MGNIDLFHEECHGGPKVNIHLFRLELNWELPEHVKEVVMLVYNVC
jgi:hypothetical protein